jgi:hypothetical protein
VAFQGGRVQWPRAGVQIGRNRRFRIPIVGPVSSAAAEFGASIGGPVTDEKVSRTRRKYLQAGLLPLSSTAQADQGDRLNFSPALRGGISISKTTSTRKNNSIL